MATHAHIPPETKPSRTMKQLVLQPRSSSKPAAKNQTTSNRLKQSHLSRSPKPTNDKQPRTTGSRRKRKSCPLAAPNQGSKTQWIPESPIPAQQFKLFNSSTGEALHGETGFVKVFGPQIKATNSSEKRNSSLDTSMAKPTPKHLSRTVLGKNLGRLRILRLNKPFGHRQASVFCYHCV